MPRDKSGLLSRAPLWLPTKSVSHAPDFIYIYSLLRRLSVVNTQNEEFVLKYRYILYYIIIIVNFQHYIQRRTVNLTAR